MELKQLLCPEVLGWIAEHDHIEGVELFNEYEKWFFENEDWMKNVTSGDYQKYYEDMYNNK